MPKTSQDFSEGVAITSSFYADENTHIEPVRYGHGSSVMGLLQTLLTDGWTPKDRRRDWRKQFLRNPLRIFKIINLRKWSERTIIALVMQSVDSAVQVYGEQRFGRFWLRSKSMGGMPFPKWIPAANEVVRRLAENNGGVPAGNYGEIFGAPITAHILGGAIIGDSAETGVIDAYHRVWNYPSLHVVDGAAVTANLGVNPSLTITAQAERAMSLWPNHGEADPRPAQAAPYKKLAPVPPIAPIVPQSARTALWTSQ
jgi:cholesterol oxidase